MEKEAFPIDRYVESLVSVLSSVKYEDTGYERSERLSSLQHTYREATQHFSQEILQGDLKVNSKYFEPMLATVVAYAVYAYPQTPADVKTGVAVLFIYAGILDDDGEDRSRPSMETFYEDLIQGKELKQPWLRVVSRHLRKFVKHYGGFCAFNIIRSTFDFFQGCWIEKYNFHGLEGSHDFPIFLRHLNALGQCIAASLFPKEQFDEHFHFIEIVSAIPVIDLIVMYINDLFSFYKELDDPKDQISFVKNYCVVNSVGLDKGLEYLTSETIRVCKQLVHVFKSSPPRVKASLNAFLQGYITWHLCDHRYRLNEVLERAAGSPHGLEFRRYYEQARLVGGFSLEEWAVPSVSTLVEQGRGSSS